MADKSLALIGAGGIGGKHAEAAENIGAPVRWVVDILPDRAEKLSDKLSAHADTTCDAALADPNVGAVIIGVPNYLHADLAIRALAAGKHVFLEKPMAMSLAECDAILAAHAKSRQVLQLGFAHRYTTVGQKAKEVVDSGALGAIHHVKAHIHLRRSVPGLGRWFTTKAESGGGALMDLGCHLIDLSLWLLGHPPVRDVLGQTYSLFGKRMRDYNFAEMWAGPPNYDGVCDVDDSAHALVRLANGCTLQLDVSWAGNFPEPNVPLSQMILVGDAGGLAFQLFGDHVMLTTEVDKQLVHERIEVAEANFYETQLADFLSGVEQGQCFGATAQDGRRVQEVVTEIYKSSGVAS